MKTILSYFVFMILFVYPVFSQEEAEPVQEEKNETTEYSREMGLGFGASANLNNGDIGALVGIDFEFKLPEIEPPVGVGVLVEFGFFEHVEYVIGVPIYVHPLPKVKLFAAPCFTYIEKPNKVDLDELHEDWNKRFLLKFGGSYTFNFNRYAISPTISGDVVGPEFKLNLGVTFGFEF